MTKNSVQETIKAGDSLPKSYDEDIINPHMTSLPTTQEMLDHHKGIMIGICDNKVSIRLFGNPNMVEAMGLASHLYNKIQEVEKAKWNLNTPAIQSLLNGVEKLLKDDVC